MRSFLLIPAMSMLIALSGCRPIPQPGPPTVTRFAPQPTGTPLVECGDGTWSTRTGPNSCLHHRGVHGG
jgi:hypothetical protein